MPDEGKASQALEDDGAPEDHCHEMGGDGRAEDSSSNNSHDGNEEDGKNSDPEDGSISDPEDSNNNSTSFSVDMGGSKTDLSGNEEESEEVFGGADGDDQTGRQLNKQVQLEPSLCSLINDLMTSHDLSINGCQKVLSFVTQNASAVHDHLDTGGKLCKNVQTIRIRQTAALPKVRNTLYKKV